MSILFIVYVQSLSHVIQVLGGPLLQLLKDKQKQNQQTIERMTKEKEQLQQQLLTIQQQNTLLVRQDSLI